MQPTTTIQEKYHFTRDEKLAISEEQQDAMTLQTEHENTLANLKIQYKAKIDEQKNRVLLLSNKFQTGYEMRDRAVYVRKDLENKKKLYICIKTHEIVRTEDLSASDLIKQFKVEHEAEANKLIDKKDKAKELFEEFFTENIAKSGLDADFDPKEHLKVSELQYITYAINGYGLPKAGIRSTKAESLHQSRLKVQKLNLPRLPSFWQTDVTGSTVNFKQIKNGTRKFITRKFWSNTI